LDDPEHLNFDFPVLLNINPFSFEEWLIIVAFLFAMLILLICSAFISATEIAFFSLNKLQLNIIKEEDEDKATLIEQLLSKPSKLLATILIVNNSVNISLILLSSIFITKFENISDWPEWIFDGIQLIVITTLLLLFGEIIPKVYATNKVEQIVKLMAKPIGFLNNFFSWASFLLVGLSSALDKKIVVNKKNLSVDELSEVHGLVQDKTSKQERKMLDGILEIGQTVVKQIMRNRMDMVALPSSGSFSDVRKIILESGHSRIPVYEEDIDTITGIIYIKDLLPFLNIKNEAEVNWKELIRQPFFVPENKKLDDLLAEFQSKKTHLAIVVDEYGGTSGIIALEDIIEEIVGDIKDEFDDDDLEYSILGKGKYIFDGKTPLLDMYRIIEIEGKEFDELKGDSETIAGLLLEVKGSFPRKGEVIKIEDYEFTIEAVDKKRIQRIKLIVKN
jgi:gliding motility-associated protein GldE